VDEEALGQLGLLRQKTKTKEVPTGRRELEKRSHGASDTTLE